MENDTIGWLKHIGMILLRTLPDTDVTADALLIILIN